MSKSHAQPVSEYAKAELERMYKELTDDEFIAESKRKHERDMTIKDKREDTGL